MFKSYFVFVFIFLSGILHDSYGQELFENQLQNKVEIDSSVNESNSIDVLSEICDNSIDDDLDGFVDNFDSDCLCADSLFNNSCAPECQSIQIDSSFKMELKWQSDVIGSSVGTILVYDSLIFVKKVVGPFPENLDNQYFLAKIHGKDGKILSSSAYTSTNGIPSDRTPFSFFKWKDTLFFTLIHYDTLMLMDEFKNIKWKSYGFNDYHTSAINIADINSDGIPEIIITNKIVSVLNGAILIEDIVVKGNNAAGVGFPIGQIPANYIYQTNTVAADFLPAPGLELAAGNVVYEIKLNNNLSNSGNSMIRHLANVQVQNGITSCGDIDGDGELDVVVVRNQYYLDGGGIYVWNPRSSGLIARASSGESGSVAFIGDVDGDCIPEIGVVFARELRMYKYDGSTILKLLFKIFTTDFSGFTGITMFDFNQDGRNELVYRDQTTLRIIEGATGKIIATTPMLSGTIMEYPVVADIDKDGQAEILTTGYMPGESQRDSRVYCFESGGASWAPARSVWNQYGYHVTNVNDDLTIPRQQQNIAAFFDTDSCAQQTCAQPYNAFMTQATYRTQKGCRVWPSLPDLGISATASCVGDSIDMCIIITGRLDTMRLVPVSCYPSGLGIPDAPPLETIILTKDTTCVRVPRFVGIDTLAIIVNEDGRSLYPILLQYTSPECRYENNVFILPLPPQKTKIDLGPDQSGCLGKVITLTAPPGYVSYRWSDGSIDTIYTTGAAGLHWLEATDICGQISRDTIRLDINPSFTIDLGDDKNVCPGETISLSYVEPYDQLFWSPKGRVSCYTCANTVLTGTSDTLIALFVVRDGCTSTDTIAIDYVDMDLVSLGPDSRLCPGLLDSFIINVPYDSVVWSPVSLVSCDTCRAIRLLGLDDFALSVIAYKDGCETRDTVSIDYIQRAEVTRNINLCENQSYTYGDSTWTQSGQYMYAVGQCDSLITFVIKTYQDAEMNANVSICAGDSIFLGGQWRKMAGNYTEVLTSFVGCDSLIRTNLEILPTVTNQGTIQVCAGKATTIHGIVRNAPGVYNQTFSGSFGCDSTSVITLTWGPPILYRDTIRICDSESATIHGQIRTLPGLYAESFKTSEGCDSSASIYLSISPFKVTERSYKLCDGDTIIINNRAITKGGIVTDTIKVSAGCDEIIKNTVSLFSPSIAQQKKYLCPDSIIKLDNGEIIDKEGVFNVSGFKNTVGCDSTVILTVQQVSRPPQPTVEVDCENEEYSIIIPPSNEWLFGEIFGPELDTVIIPNVGGNITIPIRSIYSCPTKPYQVSLPAIPNISEVPSINDQQQASNEGISLMIALDPKQWTVLWSPSALTSCDTCLNTIISSPVDTTFSILLTHISGCEFEQSFRVSRTPVLGFDIPNIINQSSQGGNETWRWTVPATHSLIQCIIYDRWGNAVYKSGQNILWDGQFKGQAVAQGVYVYVLKINDAQGNVLIMKGDLTVVR